MLGVNLDEEGSFLLMFVQDVFLSDLRALQPQLCITAAYGNILPTKFLNIPTLG